MRWKVIIGAVISLVFVIYAVSQVDFKQVGNAFAEASYIWTIPMMLSVMVAMWIRTLRWQKLISPIGQLKATSLFPSLIIGFMANNLLPARVGEVVRAISLSQKHNLSRASVFATVVAERVFDSFGLLIVFFITLFFVDYPWLVKQGGITALVVSLLLMALLFVLKVKTDTAVRWVCSPIRILSAVCAGKAETILRKFSVGLTMLTDPITVITVLLYSVVLWFFSGASGYLIFLAFDLHPDLWAAFVVLFVTVLAVSLPSSPGFVGTFHGACIIAFGLINSLGMFGHEVSDSVALSYSIVLWSCQFFPVTIIGLVFLKKEHLRFRDFEKAQVSARPAQPT